MVWFFLEQQHLQRKFTGVCLERRKPLEHKNSQFALVLKKTKNIKSKVKKKTEKDNFSTNVRSKNLFQVKVVLPVETSTPAANMQRKKKKKKDTLTPWAQKWGLCYEDHLFQVKVIWIRGSASSGNKHPSGIVFYDHACRNSRVICGQTSIFSSTTVDFFFKKRE